MEASTKPQDNGTLSAAPAREPSPMYRTAMAVSKPVMLWGRLEAEGVEVLPESGPVLVVGNHDSHWDPIAVGVSAIRRRQIKALAKAELWNVRGLTPVLNGMGQIPIERGAGDVGALARAIEELRRGACIGVFPEGTRSQGREMRARSGVGRLALEVPEAKLVCVVIKGTTELTSFPHRPQISVRFFEPAGGQAQPGEQPGELAARLLAEIRELSPPVATGRKKRA
jgi:1-acyl-sn-glycerol-3-phosphate acyltransferase